MIIETKGKREGLGQEAGNIIVGFVSVNSF